VMATGARWRELQAEGVDRFRGAGVYHAAMATDAERCRDEDVIVVGGGNSAGQAAIHLASRARSVRVVVRGKALKSTMSQYLVERIERSPRIEVMTETEIAAVQGTATVESVDLRTANGEIEHVGCTSVFVMIGADPCTEATTGILAVDPAGYLLCGAGAAGCQGHLRWPLADREPSLLETTRPGVFAAGDVRADATKRDGLAEPVQERGDLRVRPLLVEPGHDVLGELGRRPLAGRPRAAIPAGQVVVARRVAEAHRGLVDGLLEARGELRLDLVVALARDDHRGQLAPVGDLVLGHQMVS
jgi:hypothetical protein